VLDTGLGYFRKLSNRAKVRVNLDAWAWPSHRERDASRATSEKISQAPCQARGTGEGYVLAIVNVRKPRLRSQTSLSGHGPKADLGVSRPNSRQSAVIFQGCRWYNHSADQSFWPKIKCDFAQKYLFYHLFN
jgi:hypothetical protein